MEQVIILLYVLTAFVWCTIDVEQRDDISFTGFLLFIFKLVTFPYWVIREKLR